MTYAIGLCIAVLSGVAAKINNEWLVSDVHGYYAMGTAEGFRTRKYHGFLMGVVGRSETAYLVDLEMMAQGVSFWPHRYGNASGSVTHPAVSHSKYVCTKDGPSWWWKWSSGTLRFSVCALETGGIQLRWDWRSQKGTKERLALPLKIRSFWALRELHGIGGHFWTPEEVSHEGELQHGGEIYAIQVKDSQGVKAFCCLQGRWSRSYDPLWYRNFYYSEEAARGYSAQEDLYSALTFEVSLASGESGIWQLSGDGLQVQGQGWKQKRRRRQAHPRSHTSDFMLYEPPGIVAGFPWFGEWGRDTFISLPGIVASLFKEEINITSWTYELLHRWGRWIDKEGMLPNLLGKGGETQWESADATLWWCHSLAALWMFSLCHFCFKPSDLEREFKVLLDHAIQSIKAGEHRFLKLNAEGCLEVTEPHVTWMDARVNDKSVTPRLGLLPEINALWFQALYLQGCWKGVVKGTPGVSERFKPLGKSVLSCREGNRPNIIFLHSIPLAPSFILQENDLLHQDLSEIEDKFWTPVGLRTLGMDSPEFHPRYEGSPLERDLAYHQGSVWGWLGGHYEMARSRLHFIGGGANRCAKSRVKTFSTAVLQKMPIKNHIPEIFDAISPYTPRGAPAQAWSLACVEEARLRVLLRPDEVFAEMFAERFS